RRVRTFRRVLPEDRLQPDERQGRPGTRTSGDEIWIVVTPAPPLGDGQPTPASVLLRRVRTRGSDVPADTAHVLRRRAAREDTGRDTGVGEYLHRALVEDMRLRHLRRFRVTRDQQGIDTQPRQQYR